MRLELEIAGQPLRLDIESQRLASLAELIPAACRRPPGAGTGAAAAVHSILADRPLPAAPPGHERLGRRLAAWPGGVLFQKVPVIPGLSLRLERGGAGMVVAASYRQNRAVEVVRARYKGVPVASLHQNLLYYAVFFPIMALAEESGAVATHAACVRRRGKTVLVSGLGGAGKTTLALALLDGDGTAMLSDNLVLLERGHVRGVPELVRRDERLRSLLPTGVEASLTRSRHAAEHGRWFVEPPQLGGEAPAVDVVFQVDLGERFAATALNLEDCVRRQLAMDRLALEVEAYRQFVAVLALAGLADAGHSEARLRETLAGARCYRVTVPEGRPLASVLDALDEVVEGGGS